MVSNPRVERVRLNYALLMITSKYKDPLESFKTGAYTYIKSQGQCTRMHKMPGISHLKSSLEVFFQYKLACTPLYVERHTRQNVRYTLFSY